MHATYAEHATPLHGRRREDGAVNTIQNLQDLVRRGFQASPVHNDDGEIDALLYSRKWRCGTVDVLVLHSHTEAFAYRTTEVESGTPLTPRREAIRWQSEGDPETVTRAVLELRPADGASSDAPPRTP
ncbi:hypothetical protein [Parasphingorhabdus pacifica]